MRQLFSLISAGALLVMLSSPAMSTTVDFEGTMWDAAATLELTPEVSSQEEIRRIQFGYPMGLRLEDDTVLAVHWCVEDGVCGIRWTRLRVVK